MPNQSTGAINVLRSGASLDAAMRSGAFSRIMARSNDTPPPPRTVISAEPYEAGLEEAQGSGAEEHSAEFGEPRPYEQGPLGNVSLDPVPDAPSGAVDPEPGALTRPKRRVNILRRSWRFVAAAVSNAVYRNVTRRIVFEVDHNADTRLNRATDRLACLIENALAQSENRFASLESAVRLDLATRSEDLGARINAVEQLVHLLIYELGNVETRTTESQATLRADLLDAVKTSEARLSRWLERDLIIKLVSELNFTRLQLVEDLDDRILSAAETERAWIRLHVDRTANALTDQIDNRVSSLNKVLHTETGDLSATVRRGNELVRQSMDELASALRGHGLGAVTGGAPHDDGVIGQTLSRIESYVLQAARRGTTNCSGFILVRSSVGYVMCPEGDYSLLAALLDAGELEAGTRLLIERLLQPGDCFVDVGANIGLHTIAGARAVGPGGKVYAFEPFPLTRAALEQSLYINGLSSRVITIEAAAFSRPGKQEFYLGGTSGHHSLFSEVIDTNFSRGSVEVTTVTLDETLPAQTRVDLIKIDVEGAELDVLAGAARVLGENPNVAAILEFGREHLTHRGISETEWFKGLRAVGFDQFFAINDETGELKRVLADAERTVADTNILALPPKSRLLRRLVAQ